VNKKEKKEKVAVIGCGKMGLALLSAISSSPEFITSGVEKDAKRATALRDKGHKVFKSVKELDETDVYVIAVKPQDMAGVLEELSIRQDVSESIVASIAAGIKIGYIRKYLKKSHIARLMPNTPALIGQGVTGIAFPSAGKKEKTLIEKIFRHTGETLFIEEGLMNALTAVSGSGPAYFFLMAEIMEKFALENGIEKEKAKSLISQTVAGSGLLMKEKMSDSDFTGLREDVTSPGGTTEAALNHLLENGFEKIFKEAMEKARDKF